MKYLRKFNESIISENLEDICLELEDIGYSISINEIGGSDYYYLLCSTPIRKPAKWNTIKDYALRMKDYLGDKFIQFEYLPAEGDEYLSEILDEFTNLNYLHGFAIKYIDT